MAAAALAFAAGAVVAQVPAPVDSEHKAAVKELLDVMNYKQVMSQMGNMMAQQMPKMMEQMIEGTLGKGKLTPEQKADANKYARESMAKSSAHMAEMYNDPKVVEGFEDIMARAYAKHFTIDELRAITAFYAGPAGKKALTMMPQMMQETMPELMAIIAPRMNALVEKLAKDVVAQVEKNKEGKLAPSGK
jgi:hypothetical protein